MKRFYVVLILVLVISIVGVAKGGKKVLLVFSYHPGHTSVQEAMQGVEEVFQGRKLTVDKFFMDAERKADPEWLKRSAKEARLKIRAFQPEVILVFGDSACEYVAKPLIEDTVPVVFSGIKGKPEDYGFPAENVTGVFGDGTGSGIDRGRAAAAMAIRILEGEKPSDIPVMLPTKDVPKVGRGLEGKTE